MTSGSIVASLVSLAVGAAAGALIGYRIGFKKGRESIDDKLNEVTDYWRTRVDKIQEKLDKVEGKKRPEKKSRDENSELYSDTPSTETKISYTKYQEKIKNEAVQEKYHNLYNADKTEKFPDDPLIDPEPAPTHGAAELPEYLEVIDEELYSETALSYSKYTYRWNNDNQVLLDEYQDKAPEELYSKLIGRVPVKAYLSGWVKDLEEQLNTDPDDQVLYLRDDEHEADYEILLD